MKYILISLMFLMGCTGRPSLCTYVFKDFKYEDYVKVKGGFYNGQTGIIINKAWIYTTDSCNTAGFEVKLDSTKETVRIDQNNIEED